ncbi:hypothetical protein PR001_g29320 [Phytophthora rubi]|uniref:Uncharacterized protein n=1 Tax=Phytophthora rubi TaxID=129364 RepID=A0A6A3H330_9STRA|nr:hypothetical protein PR002_g29280 [Phytophthora rubi]KAE8963613.1 hypothetical protein PR001_g29320 [Phytophthora rubi]
MKKRKVAAPKSVKKAVGAKLKKEEEKGEDDQKMTENESSRDERRGEWRREESEATEEEDDKGNERKRDKRDAIKSYSGCEAEFGADRPRERPARQQDEIRKNEEEANEATQRGKTSGRGVRVEPIATE